MYFLREGSTSDFLYIATLACSSVIAFLKLWTRIHTRLDTHRERHSNHRITGSTCRKVTIVYALAKGFVQIHAYTQKNMSSHKHPPQNNKAQRKIVYDTIFCTSHITSTVIDGIFSLFVNDKVRFIRQFFFIYLPKYVFINIHSLSLNEFLLPTFHHRCYIQDIHPFFSVHLYVHFIFLSR